MTQLAIFVTTILTLCCVACQSTPPIQQSKPIVPQPTQQSKPIISKSLPPPTTNQPVQVSPTTTVNQPTYSDNTLVIFYKDAFKSAVVSAVEQRQAEIIYDYNLMNGFAIRLSNNDNINKAIQDLNKATGVLTVNKDDISIPPKKMIVPLFSRKD